MQWNLWPSKLGVSCIFFLFVLFSQAFSARSSLNYRCFAKHCRLNTFYTHLSLLTRLTEGHIRWVQHLNVFSHYNDSFLSVCSLKEVNSWKHISYLKNNLNCHLEKCLSNFIIFLCDKSIHIISHVRPDVGFFSVFYDIKQIFNSFIEFINSKKSNFVLTFTKFKQALGPWLLL